MLFCRPAFLLCLFVSSLWCTAGNAQQTDPAPETAADSLRFEKLTPLLQAFPDGTSPPADLARDVSAALSSALLLSTEIDELPRSLEMLALAAAPHPQWHGALLRLATRFHDRGRFFCSEPEGFSLRTVTDQLAKGTLIPDVDLEVIPQGLGKVRVRLTLPGILIPGAKLVHDVHFLPWPVLAAPLAEKFEAALTETSFDGTQSRILKHWTALPITDEFTLDGLPPVGRLRMNLRSVEHPEIAVPGREAAFNTMPVLMDSSRIPESLPPPPDGMDWLSTPQPLGSASQRQVRFRGSLKEPGIRLVLLDRENQIVGAAPVQYRDGWPHERGYDAMEGSLIRESTMFPDASIFNDPAILQTGGPPRSFALVRSRTDTPLPVPPVTVQECRIPDEFPIEGRLEALRIWQQGTDEDCKVTVGGNPLTIAWCRAGKLTLCELGEHTVPRVVDLKMPTRLSRAPELIWQHSLLRIIVDQVPVEKEPRKSTMATIRLDRPDEKPAFMELPYIHSAAYRGADESAAGILLGLNGLLVGLLTPDGCLLAADTPGLSDQPLRWEGWISPTQVLCEKSASGQFVVLEWSAAGVKITPAAPSEERWFPPDQKALSLMANGNFAFSSLESRRDWTANTGAQTILPASGDRAFGLTKTGVVLYRMIPAPPPAKSESGAQ